VLSGLSKLKGKITRDMLIMKILQNIKITLLAVLCFSATTSVTADSPDIWNDIIPYGQSLETVESVIHALDNGAIVNAAVDLSKCDPQDDGVPSTIRGGFRISHYRINEDGVLWFEDSFFTVLTSSERADPIRLLLRYFASPEGDVTVTSFIYSIPDYTLTMKEDFSCSINEGVNFNVTY
jgi:hypothetical protein